MAARVGIILKIFTFFCVVFGVGLIVATWFFFWRPLTLDSWFSRFALGAAGLERIQFDGPDGRLTWFEGGRGNQTLVLLHGAGDQAGTWARITMPLIEDYRIVIPDLVGHGDSEPSAGSIEIEQVLAGVETVLNVSCQNTPVILVGNDLGAWISFLIALERPGQVERIIAVNGGPLKLDHPTVNRFPANREEAQKTMEGLMGPSAKSIPNTVLDDIVRTANIGPGARLASTADSMAPFFLDDRLDQVQTPVDMIWGLADELFPIEYSQKLHDGLPASRITEITDCGHNPPRECPTDFVQALKQTLDQGPAMPRQNEPNVGPSQMEEP